MNFNDKYIQFKIINNGVFGMLFDVTEKNNDKNHYALKMMRKELSKEYEKKMKR